MLAAVSFGQILAVLSGRARQWPIRPRWIARIEGADVAELPLPPLRHGSSDQLSRLVQLFHANGTGVEVPDSVREQRKVSML